MLELLRGCWNSFFDAGSSEDTQATAGCGTNNPRNNLISRIVNATIRFCSEIITGKLRVTTVGHPPPTNHGGVSLCMWDDTFKMC
jgi:hypothetical protein